MSEIVEKDKVKDENDMNTGCEHICFIANCGTPLSGPRHNTLELCFLEIHCISLCRYNHETSQHTSAKLFCFCSRAASLPQQTSVLLL